MQRRRGRDDKERRSILSRWQSSGLSAREFSDEVGVSSQTLLRWADQFANEGTVGKDQGEFVEIRVPGKATGFEGRTGLASLGISVVTRGGHEIRMPGGLTEDALRVVMEVLASC